MAALAFFNSLGGLLASTIYGRCFENRNLRSVFFLTALLQPVGAITVCLILVLFAC
jgi:hypothetical protein